MVWRRKGENVQIYGEFEFVKDATGAIIGAKVTGDGSTESKLYWMAFPAALSSGKASIGCNGRKIFFNLLMGDFAGTCSFERSEEDVAALKVLTGRGEALKVEASAAWCGGLTLVRAGQEA